MKNKKVGDYAVVNSDRANCYKSCDENDNSENVMYSPSGKIFVFSFVDERVFAKGNVNRKERDSLKGAQRYCYVCGYVCATTVFACHRLGVQDCLAKGITLYIEVQ